MLLNRTTSYTLQILIFMATDGQEPYSARYLHEKLGISERYLRRILTNLANLGFIKSNRGRNGGFVFAKPIHQIYLIDILNALEGPSLLTTCIMGQANCSNRKACAMHEAWSEIKNRMTKIFSTTSLLDLNKPKT